MLQSRGLENKRILLVEDVELNQYLARHIMESWGCSVDIAGNGALAVDKVNDDDFDLVLMDIQMPVMDGIEATKLIRNLKDSRKSSVPVVALTANVGKTDHDMYLKVGMNDCLAKPFEEAALFTTVSNNIRKDKNSGMLEKETIGQEVLLRSSSETKRMVAATYDLSMVEAISGGDKSFVTKMLQLFLSTVPVTLADLQAAASAGDWMVLSKLAHKLKSTVDSMGIKELKQDVRFIESNGKAGEHLEKLPAVVDHVVETMHKVMDQVKKDHSL